MKYLGSGGGGGIPELFCACPVCTNARQVGGRELRRRSLAIVDDCLLIDLPCDARDSFLTHEVDLSQPEVLLVTHNHYDHFLAENLLTRPQGAKKIRLFISYGSGQALSERCKKLATMPTPSQMEPIHLPEVHLLHPFEEVTYGAYSITPLHSSHASGLETLNYLIRKGDKAILWLHDSGRLTEETKSWLKEHPFSLSLVSMDCALPLGFGKSREHMDLNACEETVNFLRSIGSVSHSSVLILSHISHNTKMTHIQLQHAAHERGFSVAFDGKELYI